MSRRRQEVDVHVRKMLANRSESEKVATYLRIAQQYMSIQELSEAERYVQCYLQSKPDNHEAHKLLGDIHTKQKRFQDAYEAYKKSYEQHASRETLGAICASAAKFDVGLTIRSEWLAQAEKANVAQAEILALKEAILREGDSNMQDMEAVLKEQAALYPLDAETQVKLVRFYNEHHRYRECVETIMRVEGGCEMRTSPQWLRGCFAVLQEIREKQVIPLDIPLVALHLHIASRLAICLMTDTQLLSDELYEPASNGNSAEEFHRQLQSFDALVEDALGINKWYREGLWAFVLDHFKGQLLFIFAMTMLRRMNDEDEVRDDANRKRAQALMFAALEKRPKKIDAEQWFLKVDDLTRELLLELYLDGCYRTAVCHRCLVNAASTADADELAESVKVAVSGDKAIRLITHRMFHGRAIAELYNQAVISRVCRALPDRALFSPHETTACVRMAASLEHLAWFQLSGVEIPTERIFRSLPVVPDLEHGGYNPAQTDMDAFLSAVHAAVKAFGAQYNLGTPTVPREVMQRSYTTTKQRMFWQVVYRSFVNKVSASVKTAGHKKTLNDGLDVVRGRDDRASMPVLFLAQIARDLLKKGRKKSAYFGTAIHYYKTILSRLDKFSPLHGISGGSQSSKAVSGGSRTQFTSMFELPKTLTISADETAQLRDEARLEIGKFQLSSGEYEAALKMLDQVPNPHGYLYYARCVRKLSPQLLSEGDTDMAENLKDRARVLLTKAATMAKNDSELQEKLRREMEVLDKDVVRIVAPMSMNMSSHFNGASSHFAGSANASLLNMSGCGSRVTEVPIMPEVDLSGLEALIREQSDRIIADSTQRNAKTTLELAELKALQMQIIESLAKSLAGQATIESQLKVLAQRESDLTVKLAQLGQQVTRVEEMALLQHATQQDYHDYHHESQQQQQQKQQQQQQQHLHSQTQQPQQQQQSYSQMSSGASGSGGGSRGLGSIANYPSGALVIPPGAGLPQFNLTSIQPTAGAFGSGGGSGATTSATSAISGLSCGTATGSGNSNISNPQQMAATGPSPVGFPVTTRGLPPAGMATGSIGGSNIGTGTGIGSSLGAAAAGQFTSSTTTMSATPQLSFASNTPVAAVSSGTALSSPFQGATIPQTKILFDSEGILYERRPPQSNFVALGGVHKICVIENTTIHGSVKTLYYFDASKVFADQVLNSDVTAYTNDLDSQINLVWTVNGADYYAGFSDLSCLPETLLRVFQTCGVTIIRSEPPSSASANRRSANLDTKSYQPSAFVSSSSSSAPFSATPLQSMAALASQAGSSPQAALTPAAMTTTTASPMTTVAAATTTTTAAAATAPATTTTSGSSLSGVGGFFGTSGSGLMSKPTFSAFSATASASTPSTASAFSFGQTASPADSTDSKSATAGLNAFSFGTTSVTSTLSASDKTPEKVFPQKPAVSEASPKPFGGFSFNLAQKSTGAGEQKVSSVFGSFSGGVTASPTTTSAGAAVSGSPLKSTFTFASTTSTPVATPAKAGGLFSSEKSTTGSAATNVSPIGASTSTKNAEDEHVDEYEPTAHFAPVIDLPDLVEVKTGEEGEDVIFSERAKLYRFASETKEWKERGLGDMKILRNKDTGKYRIVMRREQVFKLCANHQIIAGLKLAKRAKDTEFMWAAPDFAEEEVKNEQFVVRFKTAEQAERFKKAFEDGVRAAEESTSQEADKADKQETGGFTEKPKPSESATSAAASSTSSSFAFGVSKPSTPSTATSSLATTKQEGNSLMDKFKPKPGSWDCGTCLVRNDAQVNKCVSCQEPKPGTAAEKPALAPTSSFKFGFAAVSSSSEVSSTTSLPSANPTTSLPSTASSPFSFGFGTAATTSSSSSGVIKPVSAGPTSTPSASTDVTFGTSATPTTTAATTTTTPFGGTPKTAAESIAPGASNFRFTFGVGSTPSSGFVFGPGSSGSAATGATSTVAAPPAAGFLDACSPKFAFGGASSTTSESDTNNEGKAGGESVNEIVGGFTFGSPQKHEFSFEAAEADDEVAESKDVYFAPVIPLPPVVDVVTGEEGQTVVHTCRAKLFRFVDKEWKERGTGDFKLLRDTSSGKIRLTMRRDQVFKVCLNHYLSRDMTFRRRADQKSIEWSAVDFAEGEAEPTLFALRVKNPELCTALLDAISSLQSDLTDSPVKNVAPVAQTVRETTGTGASTETKSGGQTTPASSFSTAGNTNKSDTTATKLVTPSKFGSNFKPSPIKNLFGELASSSTSSPDGEIVFVKEESAAPEDVARARALKLPDNFFLYEKLDRKCKGCRGCEPDDDSSLGKTTATTVQNPVTSTSAGVTTTISFGLKNSDTDKPFSTFTLPSPFGVSQPSPAVDSSTTLKAADSSTDGRNTSGFVFGSSGMPSFAALAQSNQNVDFTFATPVATNNGSDPTRWPGVDSSSFYSAFTKKSSSANSTSGQATGCSASEITGDADAGDNVPAEEVEASADIHFEPVIPMPELVEVQTGEEHDEVLYTQRAKLYVYHGESSEWKERAVGDAKILRCGDGRARIVVRRDMVHKVACNHYITDDMELQPLATSNNALTWSAVDFAEGEATPTTFALRVKGQERLAEFKKVFTDEVERARARGDTSVEEGAHGTDR